MGQVKFMTYEIQQGGRCEQNTCVYGIVRESRPNDIRLPLNTVATHIFSRLIVIILNLIILFQYMHKMCIRDSLKNVCIRLQMVSIL